MDEESFSDVETSRSGGRCKVSKKLKSGVCKRSKAKAWAPVQRTTLSFLTRPSKNQIISISW